MDNLENHKHDHKIHISIKENGEPLVEYSGEEFILDPMYYKWGFSDIEKMENRAGVIERLREAKKFLPENYNFKIWDGYRTLKVQKILYDDYYKRLANEFSDLSHEELCTRVEIFVSPPSHDPLFPAPHNTGGAVDLTIIDANGRELAMGTPFDEFTEQSFTNHFKSGEFYENRMMFKEIMEKVGFANYFEEWWHYGYGDQEWAKTTGANAALYGSLES